MKLKSIPVVMLALLSVTAAHAADITGAGSTFALPIYTKWADAYQKSGGGKVNYQGIRSSGGIKKIEAKAVDFVGSDAPAEGRARLLRGVQAARSLPPVVICLEGAQPLRRAEFRMNHLPRAERGCSPMAQRGEAADMTIKARARSVTAG